MKKIYKIFQTENDSYPIGILLTNNSKELLVGDTILCRSCGSWFTHDGSSPFHCDSCGEEWRNNALGIAGCLNPSNPEKLAKTLRTIHG